MKIVKTETSPDGSVKRTSRVGRIGATGGALALGLKKVLKEVKSDEYIKKINKNIKKTPKLMHNTAARNTVFVGATLLIMGFCGFVAGGIIDFVTNRILNKQPKPQKNVNNDTKKAE